LSKSGTALREVEKKEPIHYKVQNLVRPISRNHAFIYVAR